MATINSISYQQAPSSAVIALPEDDNRFSTIAQYVGLIADEIFNIKTGEITAQLTPDRLKIIDGNKKIHTLIFQNGRLVANGAKVTDAEIYTTITYMQACLKIDSALVKHFTQPKPPKSALVPTITRSADGAINITINMGNPYTPPAAAPTSLRIEQLQRDLDQARAQLSAATNQLIQLSQERIRDQSQLQQSADLITRLTQQINLINNQLAVQRAAIEQALI